jgi:hypothetical protein
MENTAQEKLKQLKEAADLLEDMSWRICWAQDFSKFRSINELLDPVGDEIDVAKDKISDLIDSLEEAIKEEETDKALALAEVESEGRLQYLLD